MIIIATTLILVVQMFACTTAEAAVPKNRPEYITYSVTVLDTGETYRVWIDSNGNGFTVREQEWRGYSDGVAYTVREFRYNHKWGVYEFTTGATTMPSDMFEAYVSDWTGVRVEHVSPARV